MNDDTNSDVQIRVTGLVQGVGFRMSARHRARELGVDINAENQPDGSLVIEAKGKADAIQRLVDWTREGPRGARVEHVEVTNRDAGSRGFA
jgi:acylphosphatase